jgi:hypothetical protein
LTPPNRFRALLVVALALVAAMTVAACGDDGGDEDPQEVLDATFNNEGEISSGVLDVSFNLTSEGGEDAGTAEGSLGGPFQRGADGEVPQIDLEADVNLESPDQDFSGSVGLTSTADSAFVNIQGTDYEVPPEIFTELGTAFDRLGSLQISPDEWLTNLSNEGNEDVGGTDTIHISGEADTPKLVEDLRTLGESVPDELTPAQLDQLGDLVSSAEFDVYSGADDNILRKIEGSFDLAPPATEGAADSITLDFSIEITELNEPQEIEAPSDAQPLGDLLEQFGVDPSQLGSIGGAASGSGSGPDAAAAADPASQAYLECLANAQGQAALDECGALIGQ